MSEIDEDITAPGQVRFVTDRGWHLNDLSRFITAIQGIYDVMSAYTVVQPPGWRRVDLSGKTFLEFLGEPQPASEEYDRSSAVEGGDRWRRRSARAQRMAFLREAVASYGIETLLIVRIRMASPGGISLEGIGEPIRELRLLIKDLWYRNRYERRRGDLDLEVIAVQLERLRREMEGVSHAEPIPHDSRGITALKECLEELRQLEERRLLEYVEDDDEKSPDDDEDSPDDTGDDDELERL